MKKIDKEKCIGVWLDHEKAYLIKPGNIEIEKIFSNIDSHLRIPGEVSAGTRLGNSRSTNDEYSKHKKEQEQLKHYFKSLSVKLKPFEYIILFGSSTAKNEFGNFISEDSSFHGKHVEIENAGEMTENQMSARVSEYYKAMSS